jgi:hypothetical protein
MRVRLVVFGDRVAVLPDDGTSAQGTAAVLLPVHAGDDLRKLFEPPRS